MPSSQVFSVEGILELEEGGLRVTLIKAVKRATERAREAGDRLAEPACQPGAGVRGADGHDTVHPLPRADSRTPGALCGTVTSGSSSLVKAYR